MRSEMVKSPLTESWALIQKEWKSILWGLVKIDLLAAGALVLGVLIAILAGFLLSGVSVLAAVILMALIAIPFIFIIQAISSIAYNFIDAKWSKKKLSFSDTFQENLLPMTGYTLVIFLIRALVVLPFLVLFFVAVLGAGEGLAATLAEVLFRIVISIALAIVDLFLQFAVFEILISRSGVLSGFGKSYALVRKNFYETAVFSFVLWVIGVAISVPFIILIVALLFLGMLGLAVPGIGLVIMAFVGVILIALALLLNAATTAITITSQYRFWGKARVRG